MYKDPYVETYEQLHLACLDPEFHRRTVGYWYTITSRAMSHVAFRTAEELKDWLKERGLKLTSSLPRERGTPKNIFIEGSYRRASYMDVEAFKAIRPLLKVAEMSNGQYTLGKVTKDQNGVRTVHYLNPNVAKRVMFPYEVIDPRKTGFRQLIEQSPDVL